MSFQVSIWTGIVIAASMIVYAVFQYITRPDMTVWGLFINHLWHVLVLGLLIYALCWLVFQKRLIAPFNAIAVHLYGVGMGRLNELDLNAGIRELQMIVDGVNVMIRRMKQGHDPRAIKNIEERIASLRIIIKDLPPVDRDEGAMMLSELSGLEQSVFSVIRENQCQ